MTNLEKKVYDSINDLIRGRECVVNPDLTKSISVGELDTVYDVGLYTPVVVVTNGELTLSESYPITELPLIKLSNKNNNLFSGKIVLDDIKLREVRKRVSKGELKDNQRAHHIMMVKDLNNSWWNRAVNLSDLRKVTTEYDSIVSVSIVKLDSKVVLEEELNDYEENTFQTISTEYSSEKETPTSRFKKLIYSTKPERKSHLSKELEVKNLSDYSDIDTNALHLLYTSGIPESLSAVSLGYQSLTYLHETFKKEKLEYLDVVVAESIDYSYNLGEPHHLKKLLEGEEYSVIIRNRDISEQFCISIPVAKFFSHYLVGECEVFLVKSLNKMKLTKSDIDEYIKKGEKDLVGEPVKRPKKGKKVSGDGAVFVTQYSSDSLFPHIKPKGRNK